MQGQFFFSPFYCLVWGENEECRATLDEPNGCHQGRILHENCQPTGGGRVMFGVSSVSSEDCFEINGKNNF